MRTRRTQGGMSLVELAAGMAVVAIALLGVVAALSSGVGLANTTAESRAAQRVAASLLEEVRATDFDALVATHHGATRDLAEFGLIDADGSADIVVRPVTNGSAAWTVHEVRILVRWARSGTPRAIEVVTYVGDRVRGSGIAVPEVL